MVYVLEEDTTLHFTGGPLKPKGWAIHWWGDPAQNPTFDGIKRVLVNRSAGRSASINFMCEAGRVACLVSPFIIAWGQGDGATGWGNNNLVSVENNPRCSAGDRETLAELIADQNILNGIPIVLYPHNDFNATQCPGVWEKWFPSIIERAKQIVLEKTTGVKAQGSEDVMATAKEVIDELFTRHYDRAGEGQTGQVSLEGMLRWYDANMSGQNREISALKAIVSQLAVLQGVVIDYDAIARAVNDDAAKRLAE